MLYSAASSVKASWPPISERGLSMKSMGPAVHSIGSSNMMPAMYTRALAPRSMMSASIFWSQVMETTPWRARCRCGIMTDELDMRSGEPTFNLAADKREDELIAEVVGTYVTKYHEALSRGNPYRHQTAADCLGSFGASLGAGGKVIGLKPLKEWGKGLLVRLSRLIYNVGKASGVQELYAVSANRRSSKHRHTGLSSWYSIGAMIAIR